MKLGIVTDIHSGADFNTKVGSAGEGLLRDALAVLKAEGCTHVVDLGDRISEESHEADRDRLARIAGIYRESGLTCHFLCGNHDRYLLSNADNEELLGTTTRTRVIEFDGASLVLFDGDLDSLEQRMAFTLSHARLEELEAALAAARGPTLLCSHVPLLSRSMEGNFYFERAWPQAHTYANRDAIRSILEAAPKLVGCLSGHVHWTSVATIDGIHFWTVGSMTESMATPYEPEGTFAIVTLDTGLSVDVRGRMPMRAVQSLRPVGHRWINMDRPAAPQPLTLSPRFAAAFG